MKKLLIATHNPGKLREFSEFLSDLPFQLISLSDLGITEDVKENGKTYEENSIKKALFFAKETNLPSLADDGGIEIAALNGAPGVKSRRWLGENTTDEKLIKHMKKVALSLPDNNRFAKFHLVLTLALPNGQVFSTTGNVNGIISRKPELKFLKGYPYRSFFFLPALKKFYHESDLTRAEMKKYNHRYIAVMNMKPIIRRELQLS